jgi:hypothetical protein
LAEKQHFIQQTPLASLLTMSNRPVSPQAASAGSARDSGAIAAMEHYPSTSSADESIGESIAPLLLRTLSNEATSPLSTGRSQVTLAGAYCYVALLHLT